MAPRRAALPPASQLQLDLGVPVAERVLEAPREHDAAEPGTASGGQDRRFGALVGEILERALAIPLISLGEDLGLFVDHVHRVRPCRGAFVSWPDPDGIEYRPDFVIEIGGTLDRRGVPLAFLEVGWRSGQKHSRDKVGKTESVLGGLGRGVLAPILACVVAGTYSRPSLELLGKRGIAVLEIDRRKVRAALAAAGLPSDPVVSALPDGIAALARATDAQVSAVAASLEASGVMTPHLAWLRQRLTRRAVQVRLLELIGHGWEAEGPGELLAAMDGPATVLGSEGWRVAVTFDDGSRGRLDVRTREDAEALVRALLGRQTDQAPPPAGGASAARSRAATMAGSSGRTPDTVSRKPAQ